VAAIGRRHGSPVLAQLDRSTVTAPGSDEVPTIRAEYGTIRRDFPDSVDGSPPPARPDLLQSQQS
jgi:hypothetical protein